MSPEILQNRPYGKKADVWSYGCYAYELATGKTPFHNLPTNELIEAVKNQDPNPIDDPRWSDGFKDFISKCLIKDSE